MATTYIYTLSLHDALPILHLPLAARSQVLGWQSVDRYRRRVFAQLSAGPGLADVRVLQQRAEHQARSEEHTSELQSQFHLVCRLLLEKKTEFEALLRALPA